MEIELIIVLALTGLSLILFITEALRVEMVALLVLASLLLTGVLTAEEGLAGFSNSATISIGAMFVLSEGLRRTGALSLLSIYLSRLFAFHYPLAMLSMMAGAAIVSAFINNVAVVAIMLPVMLGMCRRLRIAPSRILIPLSFAAMFGGSMTLIGTSSNLIVNGLIVERGLEPIGMFEVTPLGLIFLVVGTAYVFLTGPRLLPDRPREEEWQSDSLEDFRAQVELLPDHPHIGSRACDFLQDDEGEVLAICRDGIWISSNLKEIRLKPYDIVRISTDAALLRVLEGEIALRLLPLLDLDDEDEDDHSRYSQRERDTVLFEAVIAPDSSMVGKSLREAGFERYQPALVIALRRAGKVVVDDLLDVDLQGGDVLLLQAPKDQIRALRRGKDFIIVSEVGVPRFKKHMILPVLLIIASVMGFAALNVLPIASLALAGAVFLVLIRVLTAEDAYRAIDWQVIFLIGGFIPLGTALEKTGGIELMVSFLMNGLGGSGPLLVLGVFYMITNLASDVISNQVMAVLMTPVALATATSLGVDPRPFVIAIAFASSNSFGSPVGYHTNVMIYGAGNYRYLDFVKIGMPLNFLLLATAVIFLPLLFPF